MAVEYVPYDGPIVTRKEAVDQGITHYFTGKCCSNGHIDRRYVTTYSCVTCQRNSGEKWISENPERSLEFSREYERKNKEKRKKQREPRKERELQRGREWYRKNKEKRKVTIQIWKDSHPEILRAIKINYRTKLLERGSHTGEDIANLLKLQKGKCAHSWCGKDISDGYHVDHIMPIALGGSNEKQNLQILCRECNHKKHAKHPIDYAQQNGLLL